MAKNDRFVQASPERVFEVLSDPRGYSHWVVGSKEIRDADPEWPRPGSRFHHTVGFGPLTLQDQTVSKRVEESRLLQIQAKSRPLGTALVTLELEPEGDGTRVRMKEDAGDPLTALVFNPLTHLLVRGRNEESLKRLAYVAEKRHDVGSAAKK